jgi:hypothetical protein
MDLLTGYGMLCGRWSTAVEAQSTNLAVKKSPFETARPSASVWRLIISAGAKQS